MAGGDVSTKINEYVKIIDDMGGADAINRGFQNALAGVLSSLKANPTEAEKVVIKQKVQETVDRAKSIITSQDGLEKSFTDKALQSKAENREFYQLVQETNLLSKAAIDNPASAYTLFTTKADEMATKMAHYAVVIEEFIKRNRIGKFSEVPRFLK